MGTVKERNIRFPYGGQAVIEGVMIRGRRGIATACRLPNQEILVHQERITPISIRRRWLGLPLIRGLPALAETLSIGYRSLIFSANVALEEQGQKMGGLTSGLTMALAMAVGILLFFVLPSLAVPKSLASKGSVLANAIEIATRLIIFVIYLFVIGRLPDIKRIFQYHGAEHRAVNAWEHGVPMERAHEFSVIHRRCGTTFIFLALVLALLAHLPFGWPSVGMRVAVRLGMLIPVVAISYEIIRLAGRYPNSRLLTALIAPGMWLQRMTTRQPTPDQVEVAAAALQAVVAQDEEADAQGDSADHPR